MTKKNKRKYVKRYYAVDFDDYCDNTMSDTLGPLMELKKEYADFKVTLFTIPARTSLATIEAAKQLGDWVQLAPHGWFHTRGECLAWTSNEAKDKIAMAKDMGIDATIFRAPAWLLDGETYVACRDMGYVVASHRLYRIPGTKTSEYVYNLVTGRQRGCRAVHGHVSPVSGNFIRDMKKDGRLSFPDGATFKHLTECAVEIR